MGAAIYALGSSGLAVCLVVALHVLEPEFDPSWRMLSEYSLGRYGLVMRVAFIAAATSVLAIAVALSGPAGAACLGLVLVAIGPLGAAFIDTDPITTRPAELSRRGKVHAVLGALFILGFPLAATVAAIGAAADPTIGPVLAGASVVPWIGLGWFLSAQLRYGRADGRGAPEVRIGWPNRFSMLMYMGWLALAALVVAR
jgi:Protein of unknown function (DUF998)